jgi:hypothetical protein
MEEAATRVPTLMGYINVHANKTHTVVSVPCNTVAKVCVLHRSLTMQAAASKVAVLDGVVVDRDSVLVERMHVCVQQIGCGAGDSPRSLTLMQD